MPPEAASPGLRLLVVARLQDHKLVSKLAPLLAMPEVGEVTLVRRTPLALRGVRNLCPPAWMDLLGPLGSALGEMWRIATILRECARRPRPSYVVAFYLVPHGIYAELARRLLGVPTILLTLNQLDIDNAFEWGPLLHALRKASFIGVRGDNSRRRLIAAGLPPERLFDPPNVYDPPRCEAAASPAAESVDVVYVGALVSLKRVDRLLNALAEVRRQRPGLSAVLVGEGVERGRLEALSQGLGLTDAVRFAGWCAPSDVPGILSRARLFVMTSEFEGLPMAMVEALSCGVPVIVPDIGDVTMVARDGENAWVVPSREPPAFAEAILTLLQDEPRRQRLAAGARLTRERFTRDYSLEAATAAWRGILGGIPITAR